MVGKTAELFSVITELQIHNESITGDVIRMQLSDYSEKEICLSVLIWSQGGQCYCLQSCKWAHTVNIEDFKWVDFKSLVSLWATADKSNVKFQLSLRLAKKVDKQIKWSQHYNVKLKRTASTESREEKALKWRFFCVMGAFFGVHQAFVSLFLRKRWKVSFHLSPSPRSKILQVK